ncbi:unnamed protein product [Rotaria sordida]|uniref:Chromatin target of PRMT1 protein C-terminal domain-containing protein n=1 Tax=Rotaria sordida TaxID=392033 RepID=A0A815U7Q5_9BILA|nr:unnamed protein product [Rotaria sordida]CAF4198103.1 unnamed protein product [Rotaria sordida]
MQFLQIHFSINSQRSINYRLGLNANTNPNRFYTTPNKPRAFQRLSYTNRRRIDSNGNNSGANRYLFGGQSGMGVRLRGQGRIRGTRTFRPRTRGYLNNNTISRYSGYLMRGNKNNRGRRNANNNNNNNFNRSNRGRFGKNFNRGRGRNNNNNNNNNRNITRESLDTDLDKYMAQTKIENDSVDMNLI